MTDVKPHRRLKSLLFMAGLCALTITPLIVHTLAYNWDVTVKGQDAPPDTAHYQLHTFLQTASTPQPPARPTFLPLPPQPFPEPPVPPTPVGSPPHFG